jgi:hypothetical protein
MRREIPLALILIALVPTTALAAPSNWPLVSWYGGLTMLSAGIIGYGITWIGRKHRRPDRA